MKNIKQSQNSASYDSLLGDSQFDFFPLEKWHNVVIKGTDVGGSVPGLKSCLCHTLAV